MTVGEKSASLRAPQPYSTEPRLTTNDELVALGQEGLDHTWFTSRKPSGREGRRRRGGAPLVDVSAAAPLVSLNMSRRAFASPGISGGHLLTDLGGHLGSPHNSGEGALGFLHGTLEVVELLLEEESRDGRGQELGDPLRRPVRAVRGSERIIHEQVEGLGELLREICRSQHQRPTEGGRAS